MDQTLSLTMDEFSLSTFPKEVVERILLNNPYEDLVNFLGTCSSFRELSWSFWKEKARIDLEIPDWYFDLYCNGRDTYVDRKISGRDRYLELRVMKNPLRNQKFLKEEDRMSDEKAFFFAFFSDDQEEISKRICKISDDVLLAYSEDVPASNIFDPSLHRKLVKEEIRKRAGGEKEKFSLEAALKARLELGGPPFTLESLTANSQRFISIVDFIEEKSIELITSGEYDQLYQFIEEVQGYDEPKLAIMAKVKVILAMFRHIKDPFDHALFFFDLFRDEVVDMGLALTILCQIISTGRSDKIDQFENFVKERNINLFEGLSQQLFYGHPSGTRTYAEILSLFAYYSNNPEMIERFGDYEEYRFPEDSEEDYFPIDKEYQIIYLVFGFLKERNLVNFYKILSSEDMVWSRNIQILIATTSHREAILFMMKNIPIEKNFAPLVRMTMGDPPVENILIEHFGGVGSISNIFNELFLPLHKAFFIESLINRTCCVKYIEQKMEFREGYFLELVKNIKGYLVKPKDS